MMPTCQCSFQLLLVPGCCYLQTVLKFTDAQLSMFLKLHKPSDES